MPPFDRNLKVACPDCGTKVSKQNLSVHKRDAPLGLYFALNVPISQRYNLKLLPFREKLID